MDFISIVYTIYNEKDIEDTFVYEKLRGHNYENALKYMEKLTKKLEKGGVV